MDAENLLTKGLQQGFAGQTSRQGVTRGPFELESSQLETKDGNYHDQWLADRVGGGQELVKVEGQKLTRLYAGGTIAETELEKLGLTKKDIISFLKKQIQTNGELTRLYDDFKPEPESDWRYQYQIVDQENEIPLTLGKESIFFKDRLVFVHLIILCPVE